jgi:hypothetical protein
MKQVLFIALLVLVACKKPQDRTCLKSNGKQSVISFELPQYTEVNIGAFVNLKLIESQQHFYKITGPENLISLITAEVNNQQLTLTDLNKCRFLRSYQYEIEVELHGNNWKRLTFEAPANVSTPDTIYFSTLYIENIKGGGDCSLLFRGDSLHTHLTGTADLVGAGILDYCYVYQTGQGSTNMFEAIAPLVHGHNRGSGTIYLNGVQTVYAEVRGEGNVVYKGNPTELSFEISGLGKLKKAD